MLIMALVHARKSGDGTLLFNYYGLLRKWADYLVQSTTQPGLRLVGIYFRLPEKLAKHFFWKHVIGCAVQLKRKPRTQRYHGLVCNGKNQQNP